MLSSVPLMAQNPAGGEASMEDGGRVTSDREVVVLVEDSNLAEAIDRRPDLNFRNVTIDGEKATISLSDIPADQVESAEVSKAATPDLDADMRGGGLNLRSRPSYKLNGPVVKGFIGMDYNPMVSDEEWETSLTYGRPMGNWGFLGTVTKESGRDGLEHYIQDWQLWDGPDGMRPVLKNQTLDRRENEFSEYGANGTIDFRASEPVRIYVKGDIRTMDRTGFRPSLVVRSSAGKHTRADDNGGAVQGARFERYMTGWEAESRNYSVTTGAYLDFPSIAIDYQITYSVRNFTEPEFLSSKFDLDDVDLEYDISREDGAAYEVLGGADVNDPTAYLNDWISDEYYDQETRDWSATANAKLPFRLAGIDAQWKTGFKMRVLDYEQLSEELFYDSFDGTFTLDQVLGTYTNPDLLRGLYDHGPFPDTEKVGDFLATNKARFRLNQTRSREASDPSTYSTEEDIYAGYSQFFAKLNGLRIIGGLRYEQTELSYHANEVILDEDGKYLQTTPLLASNSYTNWFPGLHGRYDMGSFSLVGSWSNTIQRPRFSQVVPFRNIDREDKFINSGNPRLKPTLFTNYDFSIDYMINSSGSATLELFYQTVEDIAYFEVTVLDDGPYQGYEYGTQRNGPSGDIHGFRLIYAKDLGDWLAIANGLSVSFKYIHQISETVYPGRPDVELPMPNRPENEIEMSLTYNRPRLFAQLEFDYRQSNLDRINDDQPWKDRYAAGRTRLDFSGSYQLAQGVRFLFEVNNLTNHLRGEDVLGADALLYQYYDIPRTYKLGLKFDL